MHACTYSNKVVWFSFFFLKIKNLLACILYDYNKVFDVCQFFPNAFL